MKTKFYAGSEPIKKLRQLRSLFGAFLSTPSSNSLPILAGGSLRDDYMGLPDYYISDYDIFIKDISPELNADGSFEDTVTGIIQRVFPHHEGYEILFDDQYMTLEEQKDSPAGQIKPGANAQITYVWEILEDGQTYQLIFTKTDPVDHVNKYFDLGFCKAYCDGKKIRYTDDFLYDVKHKTLTIVGDDMTEDQIEHTVNYHAAKVMLKYEGFRVVVPPRYQKYIKGYPTF